jgi:hypothetical protein
MKQKFRLYPRGNSGRYYIHDDATGKQESLHRELFWITRFHRSFTPA